MTDLVIFAVLFASFVVLRDNTFGGPSGQELFQFAFRACRNTHPAHKQLYLFP